MSKTVSASIALAPVSVPAGTTVSGFRISLLDATGAVLSSQDTTATQVTFPAVGAGTYTVSAVALDAAGALIGSAVHSDAFTIADDAPATVTVDVPASVAVTLA